MKYERIKTMGNNTPRVIVPSMRMRQNYKGDWEALVDVSKAEMWGKVIYLTTPGNAYVNQPAINDTIDKLQDLNEDDIILLTGEMIFCAIALGEMAMRFGKVRILRWHNRDDNYALEEWAWPTGFIPSPHGGPSIEEILARHEEELDYDRDVQP